jgi:hypothetical protein
MTLKIENSSRLKARFVIERVPGKGYCLTSSKGEQAAILEEDSIALLDNVKQPLADHIGPLTEWIHTDNGSVFWVGVTTIVQPNGESQYFQSWYQFSGNSNAIKPSVWLGWLLVIIAVLACFLFLPNFKQTQLDPPQPGPVIESESKANPLKIISDPLRDTIETREKLFKFLSQDGLGSSPNVGVVSVERAIVMESDIYPRPKLDSLHLDNTEVAALLRLLDGLKELPSE